MKAASQPKPTTTHRYAVKNPSGKDGRPVVWTCEVVTLKGKPVWKRKTAKQNPPKYVLSESYRLNTPPAI